MSFEAFEYIYEASPGKVASEEGDKSSTESSKKSSTPVYRSKLAREEGLETTVGGCCTLYELFKHYANKHRTKQFHGKRIMTSSGAAGPYEWQTFREVQIIVQTLAQALQKDGNCKNETKIGIYGQNCPEWAQAMQACSLISAICVPIYDSVSRNAVEYVVMHSEMEFVFLADKKAGSLANAFKLIKEDELKVKNVCIWETHEKTDTASASEIMNGLGITVWKWNDLLAKSSIIDIEKYPDIPPNPEDTCTIMYTSGTTDVPKGVVISHRAIISTLAAIDKFCDKYDLLQNNDVYISYLTLAHIMGRVLEELCLLKGVCIGYWQGKVELLLDDIKELRPSALAGVPRIWEIILNKIKSEVDKSFIAKYLFDWGVSRKLYYFEEGYKESETSPLFDSLIFKKINSNFGGNLRMCLSGSAPLPLQNEKLLRTALAAQCFIGYGLTETCAATFLTLPNKYDMMGTAGVVMPSAEFKIESVPEMNYHIEDSIPKGELCIRGPCLFTNYFKNESEYKKTVDDEGFFHTGIEGDIVALCDNGNIRVIDRSKNIFKLSQGEYVAVESIESILRTADTVDQIWVYGNSNERFLVAIVFPNLKYFKQNHNIGNLDELCDSKDMNNVILDELTKLANNMKMKGYEKVKKIFLTNDAFSVDNGLLTPSYKLKRHDLLNKYKNEIDKMYQTT